jgi:hypothetical protein
MHITAIGAPGRHIPAFHHFADEGGSFCHVFVGQQRKRSRFAGLVTRSAVGKDYRGDVFIPGRFLGMGGKNAEKYTAYEYISCHSV